MYVWVVCVRECVCVKERGSLWRISIRTHIQRPGWRWEPCTINISIMLKVARRYITAQPSAPLVRQYSGAGDTQASLVLVCLLGTLPLLVLLLPKRFLYIFFPTLRRQNTPSSQCIWITGTLRQVRLNRRVWASRLSGPLCALCSVWHFAIISHGLKTFIRP